MNCLMKKCKMLKKNMPGGAPTEEKPQNERCVRRSAHCYNEMVHTIFTVAFTVKSFCCWKKKPMKFSCEMEFAYCVCLFIFLFSVKRALYLFSKDEQMWLRDWKLYRWNVYVIGIKATDLDCVRKKYRATFRVWKNKHLVCGSCPLNSAPYFSRKQY